MPEEVTEGRRPATRLHLNNLEASRRSYSRIIRDFYANKLDDGRFRTLVYGLTGYLGYLRLLEEVKSAQQIEELVGLLKARGVE